MVTSCVDSGIAGTTSVHSELSVSCVEVPGDKPGCSKFQFEDDGFYEEATPKAGPLFEKLKTSNWNSPSSSPIKTSKMSGSRGSVHVDHEAALFNEMAGECGLQQLADEEFIAKFVLAEQICRFFRSANIRLTPNYSTQLSSNPLIHKFVAIPSRHIMFGSYLFPLKLEREHATMAAFSVVLAETQ